MIRKRATRRDEHNEYRLLAAAAVDGRLDPDSAAALEAHLAACEICRADQEAMLADHAWLAIPAREAFPAPAVRERLLDAARAPRVPRISDRPRSLTPVLTAGLAIALVAVVGLGLLDRRPLTGGAAGSGGPGFVPGDSRATASSVLPATSPPTPPAGPCAPRIPDLTAWWTGDADGVDLVAGRVAVLRGGVRTGAGVVGSAFQFDGTSGFVDIATSPTLDFRVSAFTMMLWVRFNDLAGEQVLAEQWVERTNAASQAIGWTLTKVRDSALLFTSEDRTQVQGGTTASRLFEPGIWYHVAVRRAGRMVTVVRNGTERWSSSATAVTDIHASVPLVLGRRRDGDTFFLNGSIDEFKLVIGRALSDEEIRADYVAGSTGTCPA